MHKQAFSFLVYLVAFVVYTFSWFVRCANEEELFATKTQRHKGEKLRFLNARFYREDWETGSL
jgi:hypothetical protein